MKVIVRQEPVKVLDGVFFVFLHNQEYYGIVNLSPESLNGINKKKEAAALFSAHRRAASSAERHRKDCGKTQKAGRGLRKTEMLHGYNTLNV